MSGLLVALPLQLACQLYTSGHLGYGNLTMIDDSSVPNYTTVLPEGYTAFPDVRMAYKYHKNKLTWNAARKLCIAEGGNLAIVDSFKKVDHIMTIKDKTLGVHTGIHRLFDNIEWSSIKNGQPLGFIPWKPDANINAGTGQCVAMWVDGTGVGPWNCANVLPVVCEIPMFRGSRTVPQPIERLADLIAAN